MAVSEAPSRTLFASSTNSEQHEAAHTGVTKSTHALVAYCICCRAVRLRNTSTSLTAWCTCYCSLRLITSTPCGSATCSPPRFLPALRHTGGSQCPPRASATRIDTRIARHRGRHVMRPGCAATLRPTQMWRSQCGRRAARRPSSGSTRLSTSATVPSTSRMTSTSRAQTRSSSRLPTGLTASLSRASTTTSRCPTGCLRATRSCDGTGTRCTPRRPSSSTSALTSRSRPMRTPSPSRRSHHASQSSTHPSILRTIQAKTRQRATGVSGPILLGHPPSLASPAGS
mmetsp:Transcript_29825/g.64161  ORF Transcript_29825/g.64161 Transcript_29825/m.64161 type:complete len:285 (+) Transcript_29825:11-865(+)